MKQRGADFSFDTLLSISIVDLLNLLLWSKTKDGSKGRNRPKPLLSQDDKDKINSFSSIQEFELVKQQIMKGG